MNVTLTVQDLLAVVGFVLIVLGLAMWSVPLACVVVGCLLLATGLLSHLRTSSGTPAVPPGDDRGEPGPAAEMGEGE